MDLTIVQIEKLSNIHRNIVSRLINKIRNKILQYCENLSPIKGKIELDERLTLVEEKKETKEAEALQIKSLFLEF